MKVRKICIFSGVTLLLAIAEDEIIQSRWFKIEKEDKKHFIPRSIKTNLMLLIGGGLIVGSGIFKSEGYSFFGLFTTLNFIADICFIVGIIGVIRWFIVGRRGLKS